MQLILKKLLDKKKAIKQIKSAVHYLPTNFDFNIPVWIADPNPGLGFLKYFI